MKKHIEAAILAFVVIVFGLVGFADVEDAVQREAEIKVLCGENAAKVETNKVCKKI